MAERVLRWTSWTIELRRKRGCLATCVPIPLRWLGPNVVALDASAVASAAESGLGPMKEPHHQADQS